MYYYIYNLPTMVLSHFERWAKALHNQKTLVCKDFKKYKIIMTHLRITPQKVSLKLGKSLRKKVVRFALNLRQAKNPIFEGDRFFICGLNFLLLGRALSKQISKANFVFLNTLNLNTSPSHFFCALEWETVFSLFFLRSFYKPRWKSAGEEISLSFDPGVLDT